MDPAIHIAEMRTRFLLPSGMSSAREFERRSLRGTLEALGDALEGRTEALHASLGLGPGARIAVRRLVVRVHVANDDRLESRIAAALANAIMESLRRLLRSAPGGGGNEEVAVFRNQSELETAWLHALARNEGRSWWWPTLLARNGRLPAPATILSDWVRSEPLQAALRILRLSRMHPSALGGMLTEAEADWLANALLDSAAARTAQTVDGRAVRSDPMWHRRLPPRAGEPLATDSGGIFADSDARNAMQQARAGPARPAPVSALHAWPQGGRGTPAMQRLLAIAQVMIYRPALLGHLSTHDADWRNAWTPPQAPAQASPPGTAASGASTRDAAGRAASSEEPKRRAEAERMAWEPRRPGAERTGGIERDVPPRAASGHTEATLAAGESVSEQHSVCCGGLLFLIRWITRHAFVRGQAGPELEVRLHTFGVAALERVLVPLSSAEREARMAQEAPVLAVFAGLLSRGPPAGPQATVSEVASEAAAALEELVTEIPEDIRAVSGAATRVFAATDAERLLAPADRRLSRLLLRPGTLVLDEVHADLFLPYEAVDVALRLGGWDIDPGWIPHLGRVIRFHYRGGGA